VFVIKASFIYGIISAETASSTSLMPFSDAIEITFLRVIPDSILFDSGWVKTVSSWTKKMFE